MKTRQTKKLKISEQNDIITGRKVIKTLARELQLGITDQTRIITATGELIRNILDYAKEGYVTAEIVENDNRAGIRVTIEDKGPGIKNLEEAFKDGFSSKGSLGLGLPGAKRLVKDFEIRSGPDGTKIILTQWKR